MNIIWREYGSTRGYESGGIFGYVKNGTIKNIYGTMDAAYCTINCFGGIVGLLQSSRIEGCTVNWNVRDFEGERHGGIAGAAVNNSTVTKCSSHGTVTGSGRVGGIVGSFNVGSKITSCYNTATVKGTYTTEEGYTFSACGGIAGSCGGDSEPLIQNCYNTGAISGTNGGIGGILGRRNGE